MNRRQFLQSLGGVTLAAAAGDVFREAARSPIAPVAPVIDFHVHLFGEGDGGTGCRLSEKQKRHVNYHYFLHLLGLKRNGRMDSDYVNRLTEQLKASSVKRAVLQAWDCRYDERGEPDWARTSSVYVPNSYLFEVVQRHPDLFIPCASINPKRKDWEQELDKCSEKGARVVKVHPPTMNVDPGEERFRPFFRHCAARKLIVMVHTGAEHAAEIVGPEFCDPARLALALEEGCTVIAAHAGMSAFFDNFDYFPNFLNLARRFPNLYCDTAVLAFSVRWRNVPRLLDHPEILSRVVHGSDFPFPSNALVFWNRIAPSELCRLLAERNLIERDYRIKQALGLPPKTFALGAQLLAQMQPSKL